MQKLLNEWRQYLNEAKNIKCKLGPWPNGMMTGTYGYSDFLVIFVKTSFASRATSRIALLKASTRQWHCVTHFINSGFS